MRLHECERILASAGYSLARTPGGSHRHYRHASGGPILTLTAHGSRVPIAPAQLHKDLERLARERKAHARALRAVPSTTAPATSPTSDSTSVSTPSAPRLRPVLAPSPEQSPRRRSAGLYVPPDRPAAAATGKPTVEAQLAHAAASAGLSPAYVAMVNACAASWQVDPWRFASPVVVEVWCHTRRVRADSAQRERCRMCGEPAPSWSFEALAPLASDLGTSATSRVTDAWVTAWWREHNGRQPTVHARSLMCAMCVVQLFESVTDWGEAERRALHASSARAWVEAGSSPVHPRGFAVIWRTTADAGVDADEVLAVPSDRLQDLPLFIQLLLFRQHNGQAVRWDHDREEEGA